MKINFSNLSDCEAYLSTQWEDESWKEVFYAPIPDYVHYICAVILTLLFIPGILGNSAAIAIFVQSRALRTPQNMLLLNLAIVDLIMVLSCQPVALISSIRRGWYFGSIGCTLSGCFATFGGLGSISSMAMIAYDRYIFVSFPLDARRIATRKRALKLIIFVWLYASIFAILPLFGYGGFVLNGFKTSCTFDYMSRDLTTRTFLVFMYLMGFVCPLIIIIFCYWSMFDYARTCAVPGDDSTNRFLHQQKRELQMAKVSIISVGLFLLAWSPYAIVALIGQFWGANHINPYVSTIPAIFAKSQCVYNSFIYGCGHSSLRMEYLRRLFGMQPKTSVTGQQTFITKNRGGGSVLKKDSAMVLNEEIKDKRVETLVNIQGSSANPTVKKVKSKQDCRPTRNSVAF